MLEVGSHGAFSADIGTIIASLFNTTSNAGFLDLKKENTPFSHNPACLITNGGSRLCSFEGTYNSFIATRIKIFLVYGHSYNIRASKIGTRCKLPTSSVKVCHFSVYPGLANT